MELQEKMYQLSERIKSLKDNIETEEATKQSFILPFFQVLGYDVFNPLEFVPEFTADVGIKKHDSQLFRYFGTTKSRFAILTNGIEYKFYSDLDQPNVMDSKPFYILNMEQLNDQSIDYLKNFIRDNLDIDSILGTASDLKYMGLLKSAFKDIIENPTDDFVRMILNDGVYDGLKNQRVLDKFKPLTKKAINQYINERMSSKFKETLANSDTDETIDDNEIEQETSKIITTYDELNAFAIVKAILRKNVSGDRITYKDTESYFGVLLDKNTRKWICRINLDSRKKHILISDENKKPVRYDINTLDDIYDLEDKLIESLQKYL